MTSIANATRAALKQAITSLPDGAFSNLQYMVAQAGCPNACSFCSRTASPNTLNMRPDALRILFEAIHTEADKRHIAIGSGRSHKPGVIYPHFDNDPLSYDHWDTYVQLIADMGLQIRVSSVGFSRKNRKLSEVNQLVAERYFSSFHGLRFSVSPYAYSLRNLLRKSVEKAELREMVDRYVADLSHSVVTYRSVQNQIGYGRDRFCIAVRHAARIEGEQSFKEENYRQFTIVTAGDYVFGVLTEKYADLTPALVGHMDGRKGILKNQGEPCVLVISRNALDAINLVKRSLDSGILQENEFYERGVERVQSNALLRTGRLHLYRNKDRQYYSVDPFGQVPERFDSLNIYFNAERTLCSILDSTRYGYETIAKFKTFEQKDYSLYEKFLEELDRLADEYGAIAPKISEYLRSRYILATEIVMRSFAEAGIAAGAVFGQGALFHAGHIHNVGRANKIFRTIATSPEVSATPVEDKIENPTSSVSVDRGQRWIIKPSQKDVLTIAKLDPATLELAENPFNIQLEEPICDQVDFKAAIKGGYAIGTP